MRRSALVVSLVMALGGGARALTLESPRVEAKLLTGSSKDPFRVRAQLGGVDVAAVVAGPVTVRFGELQARVPAGQFRRVGSTYRWRNGLYGVRKVAINVKKATIDVSGSGVELGDLPGPVTLALATAEGAVCGQVTWPAAPPPGNPRRTKRVSLGPFTPCAGVAASTPKPLVMITRPTANAIAIGAPTITLGGVLAYAGPIATLAWVNDRGGSGIVAVAESWDLANVALQPGDNRITVTATATDGEVGGDTLDVTYNENGIAFDGVATTDPGYLFVATQRALKFRQSIVANLDLDPASVQLLRLNADDTTTPVDSLADDGEPASGDTIAGDGFYSSLTSLAAAAAGTQRFRVAARTLSDPSQVAFSPVVTVPVIEHVTQDALERAIALADDARAMLQQLTARGVPPAEVTNEIVGLAHVYGVTTVGPSDDGRGAWWITQDGLLGGAYGHDQATERGAISTAPAAGRRRRGTRAGAPAALPGDPIQVGTRQTRILAPYFESAEAAEIASLLGALDCPYFEVDADTGLAADADQFKRLEEYGIIVITSQGDALFGGIGAAYRPEWNWGSAGSQVTVLTGTRLSSLLLARWEADLRLGRLAVMPDGMAAVLPSFITSYTTRLPGSLVYVGACNSTANPTLSAAFLGLGAQTFLGFDGSVDTAFAQTVATDLFAQLSTGRTVGQAFTPGQTDGGSPPAAFTMTGSADASIATSVIVNAGFEFSSGYVKSVAGFNVVGDGRVIGALGTWGPTEGSRMAIVSTGLGQTRANGSFAQTICLPPLPAGATRLTLSWDWNFFSEEFVEYCGSQFQDAFEVSLGATMLQDDQIDDLCPSVFPDPIAFDQGDVHTTGWRTQAVDVTAFAGTSGNLLRFAADDVGDSVYDSAILVDNVQLVAE